VGTDHFFYISSSDTTGIQESLILFEPGMTASSSTSVLAHPRQLDGLDNNDGLLLIATTNHLERLDGSLSNRPSRFDRKYLFDDPDEHERRLYCGYWQRKLKYKERAPFPDELADEIAKMTEGFSFAYLKEAFVSTLIHMAGNNDAEFEETLKEQVRVLKKQLDEKPRDELRARAVPPHPVIPPTREQMAEWERNKREKGYFPFDLDKVQVGGPRSKSWAVRSWINGSFQ
jgi:SpoVK/Ycf46/Vps4 family AAA+-type ATPase